MVGAGLTGGRGAAQSTPARGVPCWRTTCVGMRVGRGRLRCAVPTAGKADRFRPAEARGVAPQHLSRPCPAGCCPIASCSHLHPGGIVGHDQVAARQPWRVQHRTRAVGCPDAVPMPAPHLRGMASRAHPLTLLSALITTSRVCSPDIAGGRVPGCWWAMPPTPPLCRCAPG